MSEVWIWTALITVFIFLSKVCRAQACGTYGQQPETVRKQTSYCFGNCLFKSGIHAEQIADT